MGEKTTSVKDMDEFGDPREHENPNMCGEAGMPIRESRIHDTMLWKVGMNSKGARGRQQNSTVTQYTENQV